MRTYLASVTALACLALPEAFAQSPDAAQVVTDLGLRESTTVVRERKAWRAPKKIVVLGGGPQPGSAYDAITKAAPGAKVVLVASSEEMAKEAVDADVVAGLTSEGGICEPEVLDNAKQLRWVYSFSAGVERCVAVPSVKERGLLVTNMRAIDGATIAEHSIAMALALARGLDMFLEAQAEERWARNNDARSRMRTLNGKTMLVVGLGGIGAEEYPSTVLPGILISNLRL